MMINYKFINSEEELFHVIRTNGSTYEEYKNVVERIYDINYTDCNDSSFLHEAVIQRRIDIATDLMRRGIDVNLQDVNGYTAAHVAAANGQWEMLEEILNYHPRVNIRDWRYGNNLLFEVVHYSSERANKIARRLLDMGADPYAENNNGKSPLDLVMIHKNEELKMAFGSVKKPLEDEPEKFRVPKKRSGIFPIKVKEYHKYICVENAGLEYIKEKILDYATICGGKKTKYTFQIVPVENSRWTLLCCPAKMDFYNYHNLMSWICGISGDETKPSQTISVAVHVSDARLSHYGIMDKTKYGDRVVGRFQNGESFSIYLPEAYKKEGNARSYSDVLPIKRIGEYLESCGFDEAWMEKADRMQGIELEVEMAIA